MWPAEFPLHFSEHVDSLVVSSIAAGLNLFMPRGTGSVFTTTLNPLSSPPTLESGAKPIIDSRVNDQI